MVCIAVGLLGCGSDDAGTTQATTPGPEVYEPGPVAEPFEPQPVTLTWVYHDVGNPAVSDPVGDALEADAFPLPGWIDSAAQVWWDPRGRRWRCPRFAFRRHTCATSLVMGSWGFNAITSRGPLTRSVAFTPASLRQPGDVYGSGRIRLPARAVRGELEVLAEMHQPRSNPRLEVYETTHEYVFNTADMIVPNLLVGGSKAKSRSKRLRRSILHRSTFSYRLEIDVGVTAAASNHRQTFRSSRWTCRPSTTRRGTPVRGSRARSGHGVVWSRFF